MTWLTAPVTVPLLCGAMLILTLMRVAVPFGQAMTGQAIGVIPLRFRERLRLQRTNIYLLGALLLLGTIGGWLRTPLNLIVILAIYVIVSIPVQYTLTTAGVARNRVVFRRWDEFRGLREDTGRIVLLGNDGMADFPLLLAPVQHAEVLRLLHSAGVENATGSFTASPKGTRGGRANVTRNTGRGRTA